MERVLSLRLFGSPQATLDGVVLTFARRKSLALLIYLAVTQRLHMRDALVALIAGDISDAKGRQHLRNTLTELRELLGDFMLVSRHTVSINPDRQISVDVLDFEAMLASEESAASPAILEAGVALYRDEFLAGFGLREAPAFEDWQLAERIRLGDQLICSLEILIELYMRQEQYTEGIAVAKRLLALDPWREETHRNLMVMLAGSGQRAAALAQYDICRQILKDELGIEPLPETTLLRNQLSTKPVMPLNNLPIVADPFIGQEQAKRLLIDRLADPHCRLVTIVGMGGIGKTRLALEVATHFAHQNALTGYHPCPDGIHLVSLADVRPPRLTDMHTAHEAARAIASAIARTLAPDSRVETLDHESILKSLRSRRMLVLDNMEHLLDGSHFLSELLQQAPHLTLLVTSRHRLNLQEEWALELSGLAVPRDAAELEASEAGHLFMQQAYKAQIGLTVRAEDQDHIVSICRQVQGLPLGLVLAAGWLRVMSFADIAAELSTGLDLLDTTSSNVPERQRSIRAAIAWSWRSLSADEQVALGRLAVFRGSFDHDAAQAITSTRLGQLRSLRDTCLLAQDVPGRYFIHELVRQYVLEQSGVGAVQMARTREVHAAYYAAFLQRHTEELYQSPQARELIADDWLNILAAGEWALEHECTDLLMRMREGMAFWLHIAALYGQGADLFGRAVAQLRKSASVEPEGTDTGGEARVRLLCDQARFVLRLGQYDTARLLSDAAIAEARNGRSAEIEARAEQLRGTLLSLQGHPRAAQEQLEHALSQARKAQTIRLQIEIMVGLGQASSDLGEYFHAKDRLERALVLSQELFDRLHEGEIRCELGQLLLEQGQHTLARGYADEALAIARRHGDPLREQRALLLLGRLCDHGFQRYVEAEGYFTEALRLAETLGDVRAASRTRAYQARMALGCGDIDAANTAYSDALARARSAGFQEGIAIALCGLGTVAHYAGDHQRALELAQQAVWLSQDLGYRQLERDALLLLGHAMQDLGSHPPAESAYERALGLDREMGNPELALEDLASLTQVTLASGDLYRARQYAERALRYVDKQSLGAAEPPVSVYLACYQTLHAAEDPRAEGVLETGMAVLQRQATKIVHEPRQRMFLEQVPVNRDLLRLHRLTKGYFRPTSQDVAAA